MTYEEAVNMVMEGKEVSPCEIEYSEAEKLQAVVEMLCVIMRDDVSPLLAGFLLGLTQDAIENLGGHDEVEKGEGEPVMTRSEFMYRAAQFFEDCKRLLTSKNSDYADDGDAFKNFKKLSTVTPEQSVLMRMGDKFSRLETHLSGQALACDSHVDDLADIANYAAILYAMHCRREELEDMEEDFRITDWGLHSSLDDDFNRWFSSRKTSLDFGSPRAG